MLDQYQEAAGFYDHVGSHKNRRDVQFFVDQALEAGSPVLEIGCGTGRVLVPTAKVGIEIWGLDASAAMLAECNRTLAAETPEVRSRVRLQEGDMRNFDLEEKFRLVTLPFRPFQHLLTIEDQLACLSTIHRHLEPGGKLILDLFNPSLRFLTDDSTLGRERNIEPEFLMPDGRKVRRSDRIVKRDLFKQIQDVELIYNVIHPDGREERHVHAFPMRYFFPYEAEHLLARAGFKIESLFSDYEQHPYGSTYPGELIFIATKN